MERIKSCIGLENPLETFEFTLDTPDEECINCILDDILINPVGEDRDFWISLYKQGRMQLNCARTGKSYSINKDFFDRIFKSHL